MVRTKEVKQIIVKSNLAPDVDYVINPYMGCLHGCAYCYARFMKRFSGHKGEWGKFCDIKINAVELVEKEAPKLAKKNPRAVIVFSSVCDPYQSVEKKYKLTRRILNVLKDYDFQVEILTKSDLVLRDVDYLKQFKNVKVGLTVNCLDEKYSKKLEPGASSPVKRLAALKKLKANGIKTYGFISPVLPGITDLKCLVVKMNRCADYFFIETLNTYASSWNNLLKVLKKNWPELAKRYEGIFLNKENNQDYIQPVKKEAESLSKKYNVPIKVINHGK